MSKWNDDNEIDSGGETRFFGPREDVEAKIAFSGGGTVIRVEAYIEAGAGVTQSQAKKIAKRWAKRALRDVLKAEGRDSE